MRTSILILLTIFLMGSMTGCSLFGVATKGDLEKQNDQLAAEMATMQQSVDDRMARVSGQLNAMEGELNATMSDLSRLQEENSTELAQIRTRFETIQGQLALALADLENVSLAIGRAEADSRKAVQLHQDSQLAERERLQARLRELDVQISQWYTPDSTKPQPTTVELPNQLRPEAPVQNVAASSEGAEVHFNRGKPATGGGLQIPESARK